MTWLELADKHPDGFLVLGVFALIGLTMIAIASIFVFGELAELIARVLHRELPKK